MHCYIWLAHILWSYKAVRKLQHDPSLSLLWRNNFAWNSKVFEILFSYMQVQDVYGISVLPDEGNTSPNCTSQLTFLSFLQVPFPSKSRTSLDTQLDCHKCIDLQMKSADAYSSCIVDINIEKENLETLKSNDETFGSIKSEGVVSPFVLLVHFIALNKSTFIQQRTLKANQIYGVGIVGVIF